MCEPLIRQTELEQNKDGSSGNSGQGRRQWQSGKLEAHLRDFQMQMTTNEICDITKKIAWRNHTIQAEVHDFEFRMQLIWIELFYHENGAVVM